MEKIEANAFVGCDTVMSEIYIPETVTEIDYIAFIVYNEDFVFKGKEGSYAEEYAKAHNAKFEAVE